MPVYEKVRRFHEGSALGELLNGIAAIPENSRIAVDKRYIGGTGTCILIPAVKGNVPAYLAKVRDIKGALPFCPFNYGELIFLPLDCQLSGTALFETTDTAWNSIFFSHIQNLRIRT
jgi:hypothetical protein